MSRRRAGAILFEMVISMAIFVAVAAFTLSATSNVASGLDRARREQRAVDLARSRLAELEAGLINLEDLRDGLIDPIGSCQSPPGWRCEVRTSRSGFAGLTLVALTVREHSPEDGAGDSRPMSVTLRQLLRLRAGEVEAYAEDEMFEDLPLPRPEAPPEPSADEESDP